MIGGDMTTQDMKAKLQQVFPEATKIRVRQYPDNYKGSMRGYTTVDVKGVDIEYNDFRDKCRQAIGSLDKTFVDRY